MFLLGRLDLSAQLGNFFVEPVQGAVCHGLVLSNGRARLAKDALSSVKKFSDNNKESTLHEHAYTLLQLLINLIARRLPTVLLMSSNPIEETSIILRSESSSYPFRWLYD